MHTAKSLPRIEIWKNKKNEWNYRSIGINGKTIGGHDQGWKRVGGLIANVIANGAMFGIPVGFHRHSDGGVLYGEFNTSGGVSIPVILKTMK